MIKLILVSTFIIKLTYAQTLLDAVRPKYFLEADKVHAMTYKGQNILGQGLTVAVVDSGINYFQPNLSNRIALNLRELPNDNIDNDFNGYLDDQMGWNFRGQNHLAIDDHGHGTHVAGSIVASQYGIAPSAKVLPIKVTITPEGELDEKFLVDGIKYAVNNGAKIINLSLRGFYANMPITTYVITEAIEYARKKNVLVVVAAGNDGLDITNLPVLPAKIQSENLITVCASDYNDVLADFSNYAKDYVHLCAPGVKIYSANKDFSGTTTSVSPYKMMSGTSMATPMVAAVAALLWSMEPGLSAKDVKDILLTAARNRSLFTPDLWDKSQTGSSLNALATVKELMRRTGIRR